MLPRITRRHGTSFCSGVPSFASSCWINKSTLRRLSSAAAISEVVRAGVIISAMRADEAITTSENSSGMCQPCSAIARMMPGTARSFIVMSAVMSGLTANNSLHISYPACGAGRQNLDIPSTPAV